MERRSRPLRENDDAVIARLLHADGREETVVARWLIGCDGSHSAVRHGLGLPFEGAAYEEAFVLGDFVGDWELPNDHAHTFLAPDGGVAAIPLPGPRRWRLVADAAIERPTPDDFADLLRARGAPTFAIRESDWIAPFRIHRRIVRRYRVGRVFLAGDAAHIHSPLGGQGMNTGIQDAFNLAWKLALVESGRGRALLLDSYEAERRPIGAATLQGTDFITRAMTLRHPAAQEIRNRLASFLGGMEVVQKRLLEQVSEISVGYRHSPIVGEWRPSVGSATVDRRVGEGPTVSDWVSFGAGSRPEWRAPHVAADGCPALSLFDRLATTLLLFDGRAPTEAGYENLALIARRARSRWGSAVKPLIIVPHAERPAELANEDGVVLDPRGALHRGYGAGSECLFVVRPDGYVGFRCMPARWEPLAAHLDTLLCASS